MTVPYTPMKKSILDRLASRLFPTLNLMSPEEGQAVGRQGLLQLGTNLMQAGGASPQQAGTLANIGASIAGVDVNALTKQAATLQAYREQQRANKRIAEVAGANAPKDGESPDQTYERIARMVGQLAGTPGTEDLIGKLSNVLAQLRPQRELRPITRFAVPPGSPPGTRAKLFNIYPDGRYEEIGLEREELTPYQRAQLGLSEQAAARASEGELNSAALGANMASANIGMRAIEQQHAGAIEELATLIRSGRVAGSLPVVGATLDEAIRAGKAPLLSAEARQYLAHFNSYIAAALPDRGGKTLTFNELKLFQDEFLPDPGDDPQTVTVKVNNRLKRIREAKIRGRRAWNDALEVFGISDEQIFGKPSTTPPVKSWRDLDPDRP